jgi:hypothetical protein
MNPSEALVGTRVICTVPFCDVPMGTEGVIDEDYGTGVMIAWDLKNQPLPSGYVAYDGRPAIQTRILRDGFDKEKELKWLETVR